jgi:Fe2+ transport system protein FeoA
MKQLLCDLTEGKAGRVLALKGGQNFQNEMMEIGLCPGCIFEVAGTGGGGRMLLLTNHGRIAIGHGMAEKIVISPYLAKG